MILRINNEKENMFIGRKELRIEVEHKGATPKREELVKQLAEKLMVKPNLIVIKRIMPVYGGGRAVCDAYVYKDLDTLKKFTDSSLLERNKGKVEEKEEAKASSEKKEEMAEKK